MKDISVSGEKTAARTLAVDLVNKSGVDLSEIKDIEIITPNGVRIIEDPEEIRKFINLYSLGEENV